MIFRPSGGLLYHWRAFREQKRWRNFQSEIALWLNEWNPPVKNLVLIGPSAGYTLPTEWLKRFDRVDAYDLDILAPLLFRLRHRGVRVKFHEQNVFWSDGHLDLENLMTVKASHPGAAFLFTNVLGQVLLEGTASDIEWEDYLGGLRSIMRGQHWASYHDLFTFENNEAIDHMMEGPWTRGLPSRQFRWELTKSSTHLIEGVHDHP